MKLKVYIGLLFIAIILSACASTSTETTKPSEKIIKTSDIQTFKHIEGTISSILGNNATIQFSLPKIETRTLPFTSRITQKIINKSFLLENLETKLDNQNIKLEKIKDDLLTVTFEDKPNYKLGDRVKISIPKKTLAITSFEDIRGKDKTIGNVIMESLITSMVNSGQFNIVERSKLKVILQELKLGTMGLTDSSKAKEFGKLLQADLILIGTLANLGGYWNVNIRLINVSTGLIVAAIEDKATFKDIKPEAAIYNYNTENINESFEGERQSGWLLGTTENRLIFCSISIDNSEGAAGTSSSLRIKFRFKGDTGMVLISNLYNRDLSLYSGIEFYAKSDKNIIGGFNLFDSNGPNNKNSKDLWFTNFNVTQNWRKNRIEFNDLSKAQRWERNKGGGDGILSLHLVDRFRITVPKDKNFSVDSGTLWIDEIRFY